jgi:polyisoprenoid-binding protein YceI
MTTPTITLADLDGTYTIDPAHSRFGFVARHAMISKVRGQFKEFTGSLTADASNSANARAELTIQAASVDTGSPDRDGHLKSNDFFAMDEHPEITFVSNAIKQSADDELEVTGDLTVRGVTKHVTIPFEFGGVATDPFGNVRAGFEGAVTVTRQDFGLTWNAALETGGVLVGDKVKLEIEISAIKNS